ncbi:MAG: NgoPII family restriction endonuclease [Campylobacterota bacterium]|nr:NgoPII family restriction endonuclease [Campylobacterota bacterium]
MSNIIKAFINILNNPQLELIDFYSGRNRMNNSGQALERYVQDAFAGTINEQDEARRLDILSEVYSYEGNQNNPPDLMLRGSDAIEVKKLQSKNSAIALNGSYPKSKLFSNSPMLTTACRECEDWREKDIIYAVGYTSNSRLKSLLVCVWGLFLCRYGGL